MPRLVFHFEAEGSCSTAYSIESAVLGDAVSTEPNWLDSVLCGSITAYTTESAWIGNGGWVRVLVCLTK